MAHCRRPTMHAAAAVCLLASFLLLATVISAEPALTSPAQSSIIASSSCVSKTTCGECLRTRSCSWCSQPDFGDKPRCFASSTLADARCSAVVNPQNEQVLVEAQQLTKGWESSKGGAGGYAEGHSSSAFGSSSSSGSMSSSSSSSSSGSSHSSGFSKKVVQISPQRVSLKLRINQEHRLDMQYSRAEDYPIDLYYLMDLSKSMEDDKQKLSELGDKLTLKMKSLTTNFRLGFGSFVDKVLMPYVSTVPDKLKQPCLNCIAPYGFKNHLRLNNDSQRFSKEVNDSQVSGNLDAPEGGFDAIMQAIVCRQEIGWREGARRLLLFSTDAGFHYAGDGKLGGVVTPNDGLCHLDSKGRYDYSLVQDYPSISHINQKVKQHSVNIIFAVTSNQQSVYRKLSEHVEGSSCAELSEDSSNVVEVVEDEYKKISSSIEMKDDATNGVKITYYSSCLNDGPPIKTNKCDNLTVGMVVTFTAEILVTACPANRADWKQKIQIYPVGLDESMIIDLEMLCDCQCERENVTNSVECNGHGNYKCGICLCDEFHSGKKCECEMSDLHTDLSKKDGCRRDNTTTIDCSGRGTCLCGQCECMKRDNPDELVQGRFCECDNFSCDRSGGQLCSGPEHGTCECGTCACLPGWTGPACDCRDAQESCVRPGSTEVCSGHGECECGACKCNANDEGRWSGRYCENCPTCQGRCVELKDCVQCQQYKTGPLAEEEGACAANCTLFTPIAEEKPAVEKPHEHLCTFYDDQDCKYTFVYADESSDEPLKVRVQEQRECPQPVYVMGIVFGVIAAIVLIGLAILLLWKLLTTIHDRREFAKFEKERSMAKWDTGENPIYKQATSTFKNPTYAGK